MKPIAVPNPARRVTIERDENGIPHVRAQAWLDALYGLGFMHALDRGAQLLFSRSVASGRGCEQIANSPELLETDRFFRRIGLHLGLDREVELLSEQHRAELNAYCEGVNEGLMSMPTSLPIWATGFHPTLWNPQAVLLIGKLLSFGGLAISQMQNERMIVELIHAGVDETLLRELFSPRLDDVDFDLLRQVRMTNQMSDDALELLSDLPRLAGSNAWAVSGLRSESGGALLASDPHLEVNRLPAIWYEAVLAWDDGQYVMGATLPGCPLFAVARTPRLAWGVTYMKGDTVDYFIEDCRPGGETGWQYRRGETWHDFYRRDESIGRKSAEPVVMPVYESPQGILDGDPEQFGPGLQLSLAWSGNHEGFGQAITTWLDVIQAPTTASAMDVAATCAQPTLCWVFADRENHIGLQSCGRFPIRGGGHSGLTPIPAWDPRNHWQGWVDCRRLPRQYDPPCGYLATANEAMNPEGGPLLVSQLLPSWRKQRIEQRLAELPRATLDDMQNLQYDVCSIHARKLLDAILPQLPEGPLKDELAAWDCCYDPDSPEAVVFQRLYRQLLIELLGHDHGIGWRRMVYLASRVGFSAMLLISADRLLLDPSPALWDGRDKGELIRRAASQTEQQMGGVWSDVNNFHFTDRFFGNHQVGRILGYNSRKIAMPGCNTTPFQGHVLQTATRESTFAPSYHFVTDISQDEAWTNLPGGPSENRFSKLYKNDVTRWMTGEYKRLATDC